MRRRSGTGRSTAVAGGVLPLVGRRAGGGGRGGDLKVLAAVLVHQHVLAAGQGRQCGLGEVPALAVAAGAAPLTGDGARGGGGTRDLQVLAGQPVDGRETAGRTGRDGPLVVQGAVVVPLQHL